LDDYLKLDQVLNLYPKSVSQDKTRNNFESATFLECADLSAL